MWWAKFVGTAQSTLTDPGTVSSG
ncbi:MAG: hypothetical protein J07HX64_02431 [halophilic archaeon J07HX64]|nr:MAG: hypothetical protein J07HX64_02431 [halophilic archaeon J07HX64]